MAPIPITIITGFLGSGKTTILLNLIPQLPATYRLALLKNEFGDVAVDSALASANSISGVRELLNGCICCNLVGQLSDALVQLRDEVKPDRIVIETSGSAFPATLAMEVNRLSHQRKGEFVLDGVVSVIDVENWQGYEDTSYTAKLQARYTDLIIFNKWENVPEQRFDICLDRVGDLETETAWVKSAKGRVDKDVLLGIDGALLSKEILAQDHGSLDMVLLNGADSADEKLYKEQHSHDHGHAHAGDHQSEVEVLSATITCADPTAIVDLSYLMTFLLSAPKDEVYRIKGIIRCSIDNPPEDSSGEKAPAPTPTLTPTIPPADGTAEKDSKTQDYILNWAFGRWTFTPCPRLVDAETADPNSEQSNVARITVILARNESMKWQKKLENNGFLGITGPGPEQYVGTLRVERMS